jgi:hypothetical protein
MENADQVARDPPALSEQPFVQPDIEAGAPVPLLFFGLAVLLELAWLSGIGYFLSWLLS